MIEADAREFRQRDREDCEIDAAHPKAEREKPDERAGERRDRRGQKSPIQGATPKWTNNVAAT